MSKKYTELRINYCDFAWAFWSHDVTYSAIKLTILTISLILTFSSIRCSSYEYDAVPLYPAYEDIVIPQLPSKYSMSRTKHNASINKHFDAMSDSTLKNII